MGRTKKIGVINLLWIIPECLGSIAIAISGVVALSKLPVASTMPIFTWIFQISLCGLVVFFGIKGFNHSIDEIKKVR